MNTIADPDEVPPSQTSLPGRGQHRAIRRFEHYCDHYPWVLRKDILRYLPSIDHAILKADLRRKIGCLPTRRLLEWIIDGSNPKEPVNLFFPVTICLRPPRGGAACRWVV